MDVIENNGQRFIYAHNITNGDVLAVGSEDWIVDGFPWMESLTDGKGNRVNTIRFKVHSADGEFESWEPGDAKVRVRSLWGIDHALGDVKYRQAQ